MKPLLPFPSLALLLVTMTAIAQTPGGTPTIERLTPEGMTTAPHFSRVVVTNESRTVYVAGTTGSPHNSEDELQEYEAQLREVYQKVGTALEAAGTTPANVVRQRLNIVGIRAEYAPITRRVMQEFYQGPGPASTSVGTPGLFNPELVVELDVTAVVPSE